MGGPNPPTIPPIPSDPFEWHKNAMFKTLEDVLNIDFNSDDRDTLRILIDNVIINDAVSMPEEIIVGEIAKIANVINKYLQTSDMSNSARAGVLTEALQSMFEKFNDEDTMEIYQILMRSLDTWKKGLN